MPEVIDGRHRVFWWSYFLTICLSLGPIEEYVFGNRFYDLALPFYALALVPIAFAVRWPHRRWIRLLPLGVQLPLAVGLAWLSILIARSFVLLLAWGLSHSGLVR